MRQKIPQFSTQIEGEEMHFANTVQTHPKAEQNPSSLKSQCRDMWRHLWGHHVTGGYQASSTTQKYNCKEQVAGDPIVLRAQAPVAGGRGAGVVLRKMFCQTWARAAASAAGAGTSHTRVHAALSPKKCSV